MRPDATLERSKRRHPTYSAGRDGCLPVVGGSQTEPLVLQPPVSHGHDRAPRDAVRPSLAWVTMGWTFQSDCSCMSRSFGQCWNKPSAVCVKVDFFLGGGHGSARLGQRERQRQTSSDSPIAAAAQGHLIAVMVCEGVASDRPWS